MLSRLVKKWLAGHVRPISKNNEPQVNFPQGIFGYLFFPVSLLMLSTGGAADIPITETPHHFQVACDICHEVVRKPGDAQGPTLDHKTDMPVVGELKMDINQACMWAGCHDFDLSLSHPVGIKPSGKTPPNMPLDQHSRLTCLTCHDELGRNDDIFSNSFYLRQTPDQQLCFACHQNLGKSIQEKSHWQFSTRAHLGGDNNKTDYIKISTVNSKDNCAGIDPESYNCLRCHDDKASIVTDDVGLFSSKHTHRRHANHPIGMKYEKRLIRKPAAFNPPLTMAPGIRMVNGLVGCVSCHNMYDNNPKKLSVHNDRGALCKSCHNK